jgi:hypothetical protein
MFPNILQRLSFPKRTRALVREDVSLGTFCRAMFCPDEALGSVEATCAPAGPLDRGRSVEEVKKPNFRYIVAACFEGLRGMAGSCFDRPTCVRRLGFSMMTEYT